MSQASEFVSAWMHSVDKCMRLEFTPPLGSHHHWSCCTLTPVVHSDIHPAPTQFLLPLFFISSFPLLPLSLFSLPFFPFLPPPPPPPPLLFNYTHTHTRLLLLTLTQLLLSSLGWLSMKWGTWVAGECKQWMMQLPGVSTWQCWKEGQHTACGWQGWTCEDWALGAHIWKWQHQLIVSNVITEPVSFPVSQSPSLWFGYESTASRHLYCIGDRSSVIMNRFLLTAELSHLIDSKMAEFSSNQTWHTVTQQSLTRWNGSLAALIRLSSQTSQLANTHTLANTHWVYVILAQESENSEPITLRYICTTLPFNIAHNPTS